MMHLRRLSLIIGALCQPLEAAPTLLTRVDFEQGTLPQGNGWVWGFQSGGVMSVSLDPNRNYQNSKGSVVGKYPASPQGGMYLWGEYTLTNKNLSDIYVEWKAKMPTAKYGLKFMKVFGQKNPEKGSNDVANTTFGLDYTGVDLGSAYAVSFGDGSTASNDTQNVILLSGAHPDWVGRSYPTAVVNTPQKSAWAASNWNNDSWHQFRVHIKFNSGTSASTEKPDGEYYYEIDGKVYVDAKGLYNRHYSNFPISRIVFFDWVQGNPAFEVWYDDIVISTGGFIDPPKQSPPKAPVKPTAKSP